MMLLLLALTIALVPFVSAQDSTNSRLANISTVEGYMNLCLDGQNHKSAPGPENDLMQKICSPWASKACCTADNAHKMERDPAWLNFNWGHCKALSSQCRDFFLMDLCFYECSPNLGPWLVEDKRKIRNERFVGVPLCQANCDSWWAACRDELTCLDNWAQGFNWTTGINTCPEGSECKKFSETWNNAEDFCNNLMGGSFKVTPDAECMYLRPDASTQHNENVARRQAARRLRVPYTPAAPLPGSAMAPLLSHAAPSVVVIVTAIVWKS